MFSNLGQIRAQLSERLAPDLPPRWTVVDHVAAPHESLTPVVYFEFTGIDSDAGGQPLARDTVACAIDVVIETPRSDEGGGEDDVDGYVLLLAQLFQKADDIYWSTARKQRLAEGGHMTWRISLTILCTIEPSEGN